MLQLGWKAGTEQFPPAELLEYAIAADEAGFDCLDASDHFHPWSEAGQAGFVWTWLGALDQLGWHRLQRHDVTEFTSSFCSLYDAASRGQVFCESDGAAVHRPLRQHSNESDMALDGRDIALIAVACDEIFFAGSQP